MYLIESKASAISCILLSLFFLGTFPALFTLLERRGRLPQHTSLDFAIANVLTALIIALMFGQIHEGTHDAPNFLEQLFHPMDNLPSVGFAMVGGLALSLGVLATHYALFFLGLSVSQVLITTTIVIVGTTTNYFLDGRINRAEILFPGVGCIMVAGCLGYAVHTSNLADNQAKLKTLSNDNKTDIVTEAVYEVEGGLQNVEKGSEPKEKHEVGTADFLLQAENKRAVTEKNSMIGFGITFFAGLCLSLFSPAFNLATNDQLHTLKNGVPHLSVYTAFFYLAVSCSFTGLVLNTIFLYCPVLNMPKSSLKAYLNDWNGRGWALLAGLLCALGDGLQFMGGQAAGYAAAAAVQALPLVSTLWGVLLFREYRKSSRRTYIRLFGMLSMFIVAVSLLIASAGLRK